VYNQIRIGFLSIEEIKDSIFDEIEDNGFSKLISKAWAIDLIEKENVNLIAESQEWERPTDTERLVEAFKELLQRNIIALHCAGTTTDDGEDQVIYVEENLREMGQRSDGYCFYHEQDLARAIPSDNPSLSLAFQKVNNFNDEITIGVGKRVVKALRSNGLETEWDESATSKIQIINLRWTKFFDPSSDIRNLASVIELMTRS